MFQYEVKKVKILSVIGGVLGIIMFIGGDYPAWYPYIMPLWCIGTYYAASTLIKMAMSLTKTYLLGQLLVIFVRDVVIWTVVLIVIWAFGLTIILYYGWIIGIVKCLYSLYIAYTADYPNTSQHQRSYYNRNRTYKKGYRSCHNNTNQYKQRHNKSRKR